MTRDEDRVFTAFCEGQLRIAQALDAASDVLILRALGEEAPVTRYIARFEMPCLAGGNGNGLRHAPHSTIGICFPPYHLSRFDIARVATWLEPRDAFHPNIKWPFICLGHMPPGTGIEEIVYQIHEVIAWQRVTMTELDALNHDACAWARSNRDRHPLDVPPLKRRSLEYALEPIRVPENRP